jgi:hypothetical protein
LILLGIAAAVIPAIGHAGELPPYTGRLRIVRSYAELKAAVAAARAGDRILLRSATYSGPALALARSGTPSSPIQLVAEQLHGPAMRAALVVTGSDWLIWGLSWCDYDDLCDLIHIHAPRTTVLRCRFLEVAGKDPARTFCAVAVMGGGTGAQIGYNEFHPRGYDYKNCSSIYNRGRRGGIRISGYTASSVPRDVRIWRNYFHDFPSKSAPDHALDLACGLVGANHTYKVRKPSCLVLGTTGTSANIPLNSLVEYNLFVNCDQGTDSNCMETKSSCNLIRYNHFVGCNSYFGILQGFDNQLNGNRWENSLRMVVQSRGGCLNGNVTTGSASNHRGLEIFAGQVPSGSLITNRMPAASKVTLCGGDYHKIWLGRAYSGYTCPASDITFKAVRVRGVLLTAANYRTLPGVYHGLYDRLSIKFSAQPGEPVCQPVRLARADVGPDAPWQG